MHWTLWTILISAIIVAIEYLIMKCLLVASSCYQKTCEDIKFKIWHIVVLVLCVLTPVMNIATIFAFPALVFNGYYYIQLKDIEKEENKNNLMLRILNFFGKEL